MPIPFRDQDEIGDLGIAAFLRLEADAERPGYRGALFQITARGEPVEFTYNRVATPGGFLWRPGDPRRAALKQLAVSLLATCSRAPRLLLCLAAQAPGELFTADLRVALPVGRVALPGETMGFSTLETHEALAPAGEMPGGPGEATGGAGAGGASVAVAGNGVPPPGTGAADPPLDLFWFPAPPASGSPERRLPRALHSRGLLHEPFARAGTGLHEVYGEPDAPSFASAAPTPGPAGRP